MDKNLFMNLSWDVPLDSQEKAIVQLASMENLDPKSLLQPLGKEYWENAAKILRSMGYPRISDVIEGLFAWLQDLNWPGSMIIIEILKSLPENVFVQYLELAVKDAIETDDEIWLSNLSTLFSEMELTEDDFESKDIYIALFNDIESNKT